MSSYTFRKSVLTQPETWSVTPFGLDYTIDGVTHFDCPYQDISSVRLKYQPSRAKTNNYVCEIEFFPPKTLIVKIPSISYVSFANFEDKGPAYSSFVKDLLTEIAKINPKCKFYSGKKMSAFILENAFTLVAVILLFWLFTIMGEAITGLIAVKVILIIYYLYFIIKGFIINKPGYFDPNAISSKVLPVTSSSSDQRLDAPSEEKQ